ncbi:MAG TPA: PapC/FimD family outer membrane usher protein, partial [Achromobacter sp.]|nr:PapC/FimD family outer membrane usher protein [Achromobacter sp.]
MLVACAAEAAEELEFNTDVLDIKDRQNFDLSVFARANYIMPGTYNLTLHVNQNQLNDHDVSFLAPAGDPKGSVACLSPEVVSQLDLRASAECGLTWWNG